MAVPSAKSRWGVIGILSAAQFVMVLDTTVMNVSISQVVEDLDTTVVGLQSAITVYTLVMAAFMLVGGRLGDRWGAKRGFAIGLAVYGVGSLVTAAAPNLGVLLVGWSVIEGLGAVLVIPAIASLIAGTYQGSQRALAYGILGGVGGASAAAGPVIGGWVTTSFTWRVVFVVEGVLVVVLLGLLRLIPATQPKEGKLDVKGAALSAIGLGLAVFGVLRSSQWGWILPSPAVTVAPLGLSPVLWLIVAGGAVLVAFARHQERLAVGGGQPLIDLRMLRVPRMRAGLTTLFGQQVIVAGTFFVLPLYLQTVLGFDALQTGLRVLPLSVGLLVAALGGSLLTARYGPKRVVAVGLGLMLAGELTLLQVIGPELRGAGFAVGMAGVGIGLGLLASQLGNVIMSSVPTERGGEAGGLQGTAQNLGASMGTALIGSILIASLAGSFQQTVARDPELPEPVRIAAIEAADRGVSFITVEQAGDIAADAGVDDAAIETLVTAYSGAQVAALRTALAAISIFALVALVYVRRLSEGRDEETGDRSVASPEPT